MANTEPYPHQHHYDALVQCAKSDTYRLEDRGMRLAFCGASGFLLWESIWH